MKRTARGLPPQGSQPATSASDTDSQASDCNPCFPRVKRMVDKYATPSKKPPVSRIQTPGSASAYNRRGAQRPANNAANGNNQNGNQKLRIYDPVQVSCRVRPLDRPDDESCVEINDAKTLTLVPGDVANWKTKEAKKLTYSFEKVYNDVVGQEVIFQEMSLPLVKDLLEGKSGLLFAYGVTGSGKTYTMSGTATDPGIMPRSIDALFNSIKDYKSVKHIFKPDRMNGFEIQSKADAMFERQKEMTAFIAKTPRLRSAARPGTPGGGDLDSDQRTRDPTVLPVRNQDSVYAVFITYIEIYNNWVYDLLDESPIEMHKKAGLQSKMLREDANHNIYVNGVTEVEVESAEDALEVFQRGQRRRRMAHTALNTESSRSHSIFNIRLVQAPLDSQGEEVVDDKSLICVSQLSLVDLAGSERYGRTNAIGERLKEAGQINSSLMTLRQCMEALRQNQQSGTEDLIPYRNTKLTHFLKSYFEGEGRVKMILCVNPRVDDYDENIHVMSFADLTQTVKVTRPEPRIDPMTPGRRKANELYKEAKKRLVLENVISEGDLPVSDVDLVFGLGPPLPLCKMTRADEEELLLNLKRALEQRIRGRAELHSLIMDKRNTFRARIVILEGEMESLRGVNRSLRTQLTSTVEAKESAENVIRTMEFEKSELQIKYEELEKANRELKEELENGRMEARQIQVAHVKERERLKSDLDLQRELDAYKRERQMQADEAKLKAEYKEKDKAIAAVKELISNVDSGPNLRASRSRSRRSASVVPVVESSSESDLQSVSDKSEFISARSRVNSEPRLPPMSPTRPRSVVPLVFSEPRTGRSTARTSVDRENVDSVPGYFRKSENARRVRSSSTDKDKWLEHNPSPTVTTSAATVFQPVMKKKKSVHKLVKPDDLVNTTSKYCLRMDTQDSDGDVETQLYKADVLHTVTGGAQVIFNDVEVLRQESPLTTLDRERKRPGSARAKHAYEDDPEALTARCTMGVGFTVPSSNGSKRSRQN